MKWNNKSIKKVEMNKFYRHSEIMIRSAIFRETKDLI